MPRKTNEQLRRELDRERADRLASEGDRARLIEENLRYRLAIGRARAMARRIKNHHAPLCHDPDCEDCRDAYEILDMERPVHQRGLRGIA